jgi:uridine kinase
MNIVDAYIKFKGDLIIFISGMSGCGKTSLAKKISKDLNLKFIEQFNYYKKNYDEKISLHDGTELVNWHSDDAIDWTLLNSDIGKLKSNGLVVAGFSLINEKIDHNVDYHLHLSISKQNCISRRHIYLEKHKKKYPEEYKDINSAIEKIKINKLIFPYYLESIQKSKINKFLNGNKLDNIQIYDTSWNIIIEHIQKYIDWFNQHEYPEWTKKNPGQLSSSHTENIDKDTSITNEDVSTSNNNLSENDLSEDDLSEDDLSDDDSIKDGPIELIYINQ